MKWNRSSSVALIYAAFILSSSCLAFVVHYADRSPLLLELSAHLGRPDVGTIATNTSAATGLVLTMTVTAFSTLVVALVLMSNQFAPRVLIGFMKDPWINFYLAGFIGAFIYCVWALLLPGLRGGDPASAAPVVAYWSVLATCGACAGFFFRFMFHAVKSINVSMIIERIAHQTEAEIAALCPAPWQISEYRRPLEREQRPPKATEGGAALREVLAPRSGYIQGIDVRRLRQICSDPSAPPDLVIYEEYFVGQFVLKGTPLATCATRGVVDARLERRIARAFHIEGYRTIEQDVAFGLRQLVDVAIKAGSPAVSDPTTAQNCIDYIGVVLAELSRRRPPQDRIEVEAGGGARVFMRRLDFQRLVEFSFDQIIQFGREDPKILERVLWTLGQIARVCPKLDYLEILLRYLGTIEAAVGDALARPGFKRVNAELDRVRRALRDKLHAPAA